MLARPVKALLAVVALLAVIAAVAAGFLYFNAAHIAETAVTQATGSSAAGTLAGKVMDGENLTDAEIQEATGIDDATYKAVKKAARAAGIDLNDSGQLRAIVMANLDKRAELEELLAQVQAGAVSVEQATRMLEENFTIPKGN